jgi:mono/diheme cytochrome c family protein
MSRHAKFPVLIVFAWIAAAAAQDPELDAYTGLKMTGDWELVRNNCIACHSPRLITQQRGSEAQWLNMVRWMQAKQNLWQFDAATEGKIIAYLAENYPPQAERRRAAIAPDLMPPNPFVPETIRPDH